MHKQTSSSDFCSAALFSASCCSRGYFSRGKVAQGQSMAGISTLWITLLCVQDRVPADTHTHRDTHVHTHTRTHTHTHVHMYTHTHTRTQRKRIFNLSRLRGVTTLDEYRGEHHNTINLLMHGRNSQRSKAECAKTPGLACCLPPLQLQPLVIKHLMCAGACSLDPAHHLESDGHRSRLLQPKKPASPRLAEIGCPYKYVPMPLAMCPLIVIQQKQQIGYRHRLYVYMHISRSELQCM